MSTIAIPLNGLQLSNAADARFRNEMKSALGSRTRVPNNVPPHQSQDAEAEGFMVGAARRRADTNFD